MELDPQQSPGEIKRREGGGAGPSTEPRRDQEEGWRWSWTLNRAQERSRAGRWSGA